MKLNNSIIKVILVSVIVGVLGYIGLDVPRDTIEEVVDEKFENFEVVPQSSTQTSGTYEVESVIDGDTFTVKKNGEIMSVRLLGVDAPETVYSIRGEECYGEESAKEATRLLSNTAVRLSSDPSQAEFDQYERMLAYAVMEDGRDFGRVMIETGFAEEFTYANAYQNQAVYREAEATARNQGIGLWECE